MLDVHSTTILHHSPLHRHQLIRYRPLLRAKTGRNLRHNQPDFYDSQHLHHPSSRLPAAKDYRHVSYGFTPPNDPVGDNRPRKWGFCRRIPLQIKPDAGCRAGCTFC